MGSFEQPATILDKVCVVENRECCLKLEVTYGPRLPVTCCCSELTNVKM